MSTSPWHDTPATEHQQRFSRHRKSGLTQTDIILDLLRQYRAEGRPLELTEILNTKIAQYGVAIHQLRRRGFVIKNECKWVNRKRFSRYSLIYDPERDGEQ